MSQIDKAFMSVYAKKRTAAPAPVEVRPLVDPRPPLDPTAERLLKIHNPTANPAVQNPHLPAAPVVAAPVVAAPVVAALRAANLSAHPAPAASPSFAKSRSIERPASSPIPSPARSAQPIEINREPEPRKTLTSYLQQARQATSVAPIPTRWTSASSPSLPNQHRPPAAPDSKSAQAATEALQHVRVDSPHSIHPPLPRPETTIPWSFGTVERSIKATADSQSVSARTSNEHRPIHPQSDSQHHPAPLGQSLNAESLAKIVRPIQPVWEVDEFQWPSATASLLSLQAAAFHEIGLHLQHAQSKGLRVLSVSSGERGVGRSTVAMCLAKTMSRLGMRVGLIDADYECPSLVDQFNLEVQYGWQQCLLEDIPLDEVAIHAVDEAITLFPLTDSIAVSQLGTHTVRINRLIKRIADAYDMVILDANRLTQKQSQLLGTGDESVLDAALLVIDAELSLRQRVESAIALAKGQGLQSIGLVENFHS